MPDPLATPHARKLSTFRAIVLVLFAMTVANSLREMVTAWSSAANPSAATRPLMELWRASSTARFILLLAVPAPLLFPLRPLLLVRVLAVAACLVTLHRLVDSFAFNWVVHEFAGLGTSPFQLALALFATLGCALALGTVVRDAILNRRLTRR